MGIIVIFIEKNTGPSKLIRVECIFSRPISPPTTLDGGKEGRKKSGQTERKKVEGREKKNVRG